MPRFAYAMIAISAYALTIVLFWMGYAVAGFVAAIVGIALVLMIVIHVAGGE